MIFGRFFGFLVVLCCHLVVVNGNIGIHRANLRTGQSVSQISYSDIINSFILKFQVLCTPSNFLNIKLFRILNNHEGNQQHNHEGEDNAPEDMGDAGEDNGPEDEHNREDPDRSNHYAYYSHDHDYLNNPCDMDEPGALDRAECAYLFPTLAPSAVPTGNPTFTASVDFSAAQVSILMASDGYRDAHFGHAVSLTEHTAAVGAYAEGNGGSTYVFQLDNVKGGSGLRWNQVGIVTSADDNDDYFGYSVALNNETLYVGAYKSDLSAGSSGAVYVFNDDGTGSHYKQTGLLSSFTPAANEFFGYALASDGPFTLVGAYGNNDRGNDAGIVYVFQSQPTMNTYVNIARLYAADATEHDAFGSAVSMHGNLAVIGAHGDETRGTASGSAYVYVYDSGSRVWAQDAKLTGSSVNAHDYFGYSVSIHGSFVLVGAYHGDGAVESSGVVYVFMQAAFKSGNTQLSGWYEITKLAPQDGTSSSYFGYSLSLSKNIAIVGAPGDDTLANAAGASYIYESGNHHWQMTYKMYGKGSQYDSFGCAVAMCGRIAVSGSLLGDGLTTDSGSAFVFTPKDEYTSRKTQTKESMESQLHVRFMKVEKEIEQASPFEMVAAVGFLAVVLMLFCGLICRVRSGNKHAESLSVADIPLRQFLAAQQSMAIAKSVTPKNSGGSKSKSSKGSGSSSKKKGGPNFHSLPSDSGHSMDSSSSVLMSGSSNSSAMSSSNSTRKDFGGLFASRAMPLSSTLKDMDESSASRRSSSSNRQQHEKSYDDTELMEGHMSISEDGMIDSKDRNKRNRKLRVAELAKL
eukprot:gene12033-25220_t